MEQKNSLIQRKNFVLLDAARIFCACLVVVLHSLEMPSKNPVWQFICSCFFEQAVPFFFVVSGFFLARKIYASDGNLRTMLQFAKNRLLLYLAWMVLWLPSMLLIYHAKYPDASVTYFVLLLIRRIFVAGEGVYWYILVMAEAAVVIGILIRLRAEKLLYALAAIGLVLRYLYDLEVAVPPVAQLNHIMYYVFSWSNNVIMSGLPFMTIGSVFAKYKDKLQVSNTALIICYASASVLHIGLYFVGVKGGNLATSVLFPVQTVTLFWFCVQNKPKKLTAKGGMVLREISAVVYFMHTVFIYEVFDRFFTVGAPVSLKFFGSIGLSLLTYALVKVLHWKPLFWLFGMKYTPRKSVKAEVR